MADLEKMILAKRSNVQSGFLNYMEAKYCKDDQKNEQEGSDEWESEEEQPKKNKKRVKGASAATQADSSKRRKM